jgi:hypothetical protein
MEVPFYHLIDNDTMFMISISLDKESASIQFSWNKDYVQRTLNAYYLDDLVSPIYETLSEADFYLLLSKVHGLTETNFTLFEKHHFSNQ